MFQKTFLITFNLCIPEQNQLELFFDFLDFLDFYYYVLKSSISLAFKDLSFFCLFPGCKFFGVNTSPFTLACFDTLSSSPLLLEDVLNSDEETL